MIEEDIYSVIKIIFIGNIFFDRKLIILYQTGNYVLLKKISINCNKNNFHIIFFDKKIITLYHTDYHILIELGKNC